MKLLPPTQPAELPTEALLARLRNRRSTIDQTIAEAPEISAGEIIDWVYRRLNRSLRKRLAPFLDLLAMRNLTLILRYVLAGEPPPQASVHDTLLAPHLLKLLAAPSDTVETLARLEAALASDYPFVTGLAGTYRKQGPGGVEQQLAEGILRHGLNRSSREVVSDTMRYLIDMRNCLVIRKLWRWQVRQPPRLTAGGTISMPLLNRIWAAHDEQRLSSLVSRLSGFPGRLTEPETIEQDLLNGLTKRLHRAGRDPLGLAVIVEYLWRSQLAIHNRLLRQTLSVERHELLEEVLLL